jgi:hypothetical protein
LRTAGAPLTWRAERATRQARQARVGQAQRARRWWGTGKREGGGGGRRGEKRRREEGEGGRGRGGEGMHRRAHNHLKSTGSERNQKEGGGREEMCPAGAEGAPRRALVPAAATSEFGLSPTTPLPSFIIRDPTPTSMHFSIAKKIHTVPQ